METSTIDPSRTAPQVATPRIRIRLAEGGDGWYVQLTCNGRVLASDRYPVWHRVERRCSMLEAQYAIWCRQAAIPFVF